QCLLGALVADADLRDDAVASAAQDTRIETERAAVRTRDDAGGEVRRHDPAVGERGEPAVQPAHVVEHRQQHSAADGASGAAEMRSDRRVPGDHEIVHLAERYADVVRDLAAHQRPFRVVHAGASVATAWTTVIWRFSAPASTSSTRAAP